MRAIIEQRIRPGKPMCNGLGWDGRYLLSNEFGEGNGYFISTIDPSNGQVLKTIPAQGYAGVAWDGTNLWHNFFAKNELYRIDPRNGTVIQTFPLPRTGLPKSSTMGLAWDGAALWTSDHVRTLFRIDPRDGRTIQRIDARGTRAHDLAWDGAHLWYVDTDSRLFHCVDPATGAIVHQFDSPQGIDPHGLTFDGECFWFSDTQKDPERDLIYRIRLVD